MTQRHPNLMVAERTTDQPGTRDRFEASYLCWFVKEQQREERVAAAQRYNEFIGARAQRRKLLA